MKNIKRGEWRLNDLYIVRGRGVGHFSPSENISNETKKRLSELAKGMIELNIKRERL